ncbi:MAG: SH3 domain-containing protein [Muribaculaceae bacterium]|nr:SH3 domain-containing protein [Muribaculaceae bacterium]
MKQILKTLIVAVMAILAFGTAAAREYGEYPERSPYRYVVTDGKKLNVRSNPSTKGKLITQLRPGDVVYITDSVTVSGDGYEWVRIYDKWGQRLSRDGYVTNLNRFRAEENPKYDPPTQQQVEIEDAVVKSQTVAKWVLLVLSIIAAIIYLIAYFSENAEEKVFGPYENGMRKTFFFNIAPYRTVLYITLILIAAVITSIVVMLVLGGAGFILLWIVKILCYVLKWVGIIACVGGAIACLGGAWVCLVLVAIGGLIWYYADSITNFGDRCAQIGLEFFNQFNMLEYAWDLTVQYWEPALMIICIPLAIFLCLAVIWMLVAGGLILYEKLVTARYNIKHPCPHCHQPSEPATYLSKGDSGYEEIPNGVPLRPGFYGLLHIKHPFTGERMPTMLLNGRDELARRCANCGKMIQAEEGTELHVAIAGSAMSGKSTLTYRMIAGLFNYAGEDAVEFTDVANTVDDRSMLDKIESIRKKDEISEADLPNKTATDVLASTQLIVRRKNSSVPYRVFINDVGGEHFDPSNTANGANATRYFRNVDSLILVIDPLTTEFPDDRVSEEFEEWMKKNDKEYVQKIPLQHIRDVIDNQLTTFNSNPKDIHLNIVLTKIDLGYIPADVNLMSQESLRNYLQQHLGLGSLLHWAQKFKSCSIYAVAATAKGNRSYVGSLVDAVFIKQLGIKR